MLTPKDAFRKVISFKININSYNFLQFNIDRSGKLSFDEFENFLKTIGGLNNEPLPSFNIIKDLFDYIDIRKDGYIDIHEWM